MGFLKRVPIVVGKRLLFVGQLVLFLGQLLLGVGLLILLTLLGPLFGRRGQRKEAERRSRVRELLTRLRDTNIDSRIAAIEALGAMREIEADQHLVEALLTESDPTVRVAIIRALAKISFQLLKDADQAAEIGRHMAGTNMLTTGGVPEHYLLALREYIVPALANALRSVDSRERDAAAMALMWIGGSAAAQALRDGGIALAAPEPFEAVPDDVQFSLYYPKAVRVSDDCEVHLYLYTQRMLRHVYENLLAVTKCWSGMQLAASQRTQKLVLRKGTPITVTAAPDGLATTPLSLTQVWEHEWLHFPFRVVRGPGTDGITVKVRLSVQVYQVEIARVECDIGIIDAERAGPSQLAGAAFPPYQSIFVSYSRKDKAVTKLYRAVQKATGNDIFIDTYSLRSGADWRASIAAAIDAADVFQLFWSRNSASSPSVKEEWMYALSRRHPEERGVGFIRPVYWVNPIPVQPPAELAHLHFCYVPLLEVGRLLPKKAKDARK